MPHSPTCRWYVPRAVCSCEELVAWIVDVPDPAEPDAEPMWLPLGQLVIALAALALLVMR